jgi:alpha-beta hydrolase superfamily lysophospholipase
MSETQGSQLRTNHPSSARFASVWPVRLLQRCCVFAVSLLICSCLTGGGRYQAKMGQGRPLYDEPVLQWKASDGAAVTYCRWLPPHGMSRKGIVIAVPGLDEAAIEWAQLGRHLSKRGYEIYASDLRGQGRDHGNTQRGNYHHWQRWVSDVNEFAVQMIRGRDLPVAYVGQSMGALIALAAGSSASKTPDALVLHAPALALAWPLHTLRPLTAVAQIVTLNRSRVTGPAFLELTGSEIVSNIPDETAWETSPDRVCEGLTFRYISACFNVGQHARTLPRKFRSPVLVQYGHSDETFKLARRTPGEFLDMFPSSDKELWLHPSPKANHDMLNDRLMRAELLAKMTSWLEKHLATTR